MKFGRVGWSSSHVHLRSWHSRRGRRRRAAGGPRSSRPRLYDRAASAVHWTATFCDRNGPTCAQAGVALVGVREEGAVRRRRWPTSSRMKYSKPEPGYDRADSAFAATTRCGPKIWSRCGAAPARGAASERRLHSPHYACPRPERRPLRICLSATYVHSRTCRAKEVRSLPTLSEIRADFAVLDDWEDRYRYVIELGRTLAAAARRAANRRQQGARLRQPGLARDERRARTAAPRA